MKKVLTYGTFDLFHVGHARLLKRVRALGDYLVVGCSTDEFNSAKKKTSFFSFADRCEILNSCAYVDEVLAEESWDQKRHDIERLQIDVFAIGDDWAGKFDDLSDIVQVVYLPRTSGVSTTSVKQAVSILQQERVQEIKQAVSHAYDLLSIFSADLET